ncbi:MAG: PD-(D/E)XK motif protein [Lutibacter sp.]
MMINIKNIWDKQVASRKNEVIKERIFELKNINCNIGTISFSKAKIFTIEIEPDINIHSNYLKRFIGVEVQVLPLEEDYKELVIILLDEELSDVFVLFIEDIIKSLSIANNSAEAITIIASRINYWKKLFGKYSNGLLTPEQQRGLFGELFFLKKILDSNSNYQIIINAWQAPTGSNQDFYFDGNAVEVKTSKSNNSSIKIANEFQLDITGLKSLYIAFYKLNEYPDENHTLLNLIEEIRLLLLDSIDILKEFNLKLESLGITPETEEEYNNVGYVVRDEKYYQVTDEFPKIISSMVSEAVSKISYEISPIEFEKFEIEYNCLKKELLND